MKNIVKNVVTFEPILQFVCPSRFRIQRTICTRCILLGIEGGQRMIIWPLSWITTIVTYRQTWQLYDQPGPEGQVSENIFAKIP